ncbi:MAG: efflux RND transporter periplasmic adaptor subunit, partial [Woeseiaceae bacterium]
LVTIVALSTVVIAHAAEPVPVSVQEFGKLLIDREIRAPASVVSANRAVITSEVSALIEAVDADVGAAVRKDDVLIRLDASNARLALDAANAALIAQEAQIDQAKQRLRKAEELLGKSFVSDDELVARQTDVKVLEANRKAQLVAIQQAELALSRTRIKAPFDATVVERQGQVGSFAMPGTPLLTIVQTDRREVDAELDPRSVSGTETAADLRYESQGRSWPVRLARLSDVIETNTRKVRGRFSFTDQAAPIGSSGELVWSEASGLVPVSLIVQRGNSFGVFIAEAGVARFVAIPDAQEGRPATLDLPPDSKVVWRGHVRLQDGDSLQIADE